MKDKWSNLNEAIWKDKLLAQDVFNYGLKKNDIDLFNSAINLFNTLKSLQIDENYQKLFIRAYDLWPLNSKAISTTLTNYNKNYFSYEQIANLGITLIINSQEDTDSLSKLWANLVKYLNAEEMKDIAKILLSHQEIIKFALWGRIIKEAGQDIVPFINSVLELIDIDLNLVLKNRNEIEKIFFDEERKHLSIGVINKVQDTKNEDLAFWSYSLYNDIMRFVDVSNFDEETLAILRKPFPYEKKLKVKKKKEKIINAKPNNSEESRIINDVNDLDGN